MKSNPKRRSSNLTKQILRELDSQVGVAPLELEQRVREKLGRAGGDWDRSVDWQPYLFELSRLLYERKVDLNREGKLVLATRAKTEARKPRRKVEA